MEAFVYALLGLFAGAVISHWVTVKWGRFILSTVMCLVGLAGLAYTQGRGDMAEIAAVGIARTEGRLYAEAVVHNRANLEKWHELADSEDPKPPIRAFEPVGVVEELDAFRESIQPKWRGSFWLLTLMMSSYGLLGMCLWAPEFDARWSFKERRKEQPASNQAKPKNARPQNKRAKRRKGRR